MKPLLVINLKTYREGSGAKAVYISNLAQRISREKGVDIVVAVQPTDIFKITAMTEAHVFSQHVDNIDYGSNTGRVHPEVVKGAGADGTLLNHAERKLSLETVQQTLERCKKAGLKTIVCVDNIEDAKKVASWKPDYIAFEDPELIGSLKSISRMKPEIVREFVQSINESGVVPLCGAGIANGEDVKAAKKLGAEGGIIATAIVKAEDPEAMIEEIASALCK